MKTLLITAAALALLGAPAAFAQQQDQHDHHGQGQPSGGQGAHQSGGQGHGGQSHGGPGGPPASAHGPAGGPGGGNGAPPNFSNHGSSGVQGQGHTFVPSQQPSRGQGQAQGRGGPPPQGQHGAPGASRYGSYQRTVTAQHRYRAQAFHWPQGFSYHRYSFGQFLPQVFFGQNLWLYDYGDYGLPLPPAGTAWVRYGPDALLIDRYSGEIVQVFYGVFY